MGKRQRAGFTHQVVQHPHEGLELCLACFPLDVIVERHPSLIHTLGQGFKLLLVQEHKVVHAARAAQSPDLDKPVTQAVLKRKRYEPVASSSVSAGSSPPVNVC